MPELPEVQTVVDSLAPTLAGGAFTAVTIRRADVCTPPGVDWQGRLVGRRVLSVTRRAKRIVVTLDSGERFFVHLGMTGRLFTTPPAEGSMLARHVHVVFDLMTQDGRTAQVLFIDPRRFGGLTWLGNLPADAGLGPEPLQVSPQQLGKQLRSTKRCAKTALLDQRLIAGIGNIYADEALHAAGIHPLTRGCDLSDDDIRRLGRAIKGVLRRAIRFRGSTLRDYADANGKSGGFQHRHKVYDREGEPCRTCRTPINRLVFGGRSTHFCPTCQPA